MICVGFMLAVVLGWPLVFGSTSARGLETAAEARAVDVIAVPRVKMAAAPIVFAPAPAAPESCYNRYAREVRLCPGTAGAACRLRVADHWDICEATGFWPG